MTKVTIHAAKTNLSKLIAKVEAGEEVIICRGDKEVARLEPVKPANDSARAPRVPGKFKGRFPIDERFFEPLPDEFSGFDEE
jgi:prevent-host-death family protein